MTEEERRRCCLLGGCGCGSGSTEQRESLRTWLLEKLQEVGRDDFDQTSDEERVDGWLDELPWTKSAAE